MPRKRHKPEKIVAKLRQVDVMTAQGMPLGEANGMQMGILGDTAE